jgi:hypothetical protein
MQLNISSFLKGIKSATFDPAMLTPKVPPRGATMLGGTAKAPAVKPPLLGKKANIADVMLFSAQKRLADKAIDSLVAKKEEAKAPKDVVLDSASPTVKNLLADPIAKAYIQNMLSGATV